MKYQCQICGYIHDEEKEGKSFKELEKCPDCGSDVSNFEVMEEDTVYKTYECEVCHYVYDEENQYTDEILQIFNYKKDDGKC